MKYVILKSPYMAQAGAFRIHTLIFPERMTHMVVAEGYRLAWRAEEKQPIVYVSAGFCHLAMYESLRVHEIGSESMRIKRSVDPELIELDRRLLSLHDGSGGIVGEEWMDMYDAVTKRVRGVG